MTDKELMKAIKSLSSQGRVQLEKAIEHLTKKPETVSMDCHCGRPGTTFALKPGTNLITAWYCDDHKLS